MGTHTVDPLNWEIRHKGQVLWQDRTHLTPEKEITPVCFLKPMAFQGLWNSKVNFCFQFLTEPSWVLSLSVLTSDSTGRIRGRVTGEECRAIYLDSRAPILVFSGFLCHLRQTKVKCFCLVNTPVIWTAAFPHWGTGGFSKMPISQIQLHKYMVI